MNNLRQLSMGWKMYADDNKGALVVNVPMPANNQCWVGGNGSQSTNQAILRQGLLYSYVLNQAVYHCPADTTQRSGVSGVLSYSMNGWMGSRTMSQDQGNGNGPDYRTFAREGELSGIASHLWVLADEDPSTLDDGWFLVTMNDTQPFASFPGLRHQRGCGVNFADGHTTIFKLRSPDSVPGATISTTNPDWLLFKQMTTER